MKTGQDRLARRGRGDEPARPTPGRAGAAAGVLGAGVALLADSLLHAVVPTIPFAPVAVAQAVIRAAPGFVDAFFINVLQHLARPAALVGSVLGLLVMAGLLGLALPRLRARLGSSVLAAAVLSVPTYAVAVGSYRREPGMVPWPVYAVTLVVALVPAAIVSGRSFDAMTRPRSDAPPDPVRRTVAHAAWLSAAGIALGWAASGVLFRRPNPGRLPLRGVEASPATTRPAGPGDRMFVSIAGLSPRVTPNALFYVVNEELLYPDVDPSTWRLQIGGRVDRPFSLGYRELRGLPSLEQFQTLECISNKVGGDLISTALWTGVRLRDLLDRAAVRPGTIEIVSRAVDGYADSIPLDVAMAPTTLVAIGMNGHVLPREHGFPARLLVPGLYGMKQPKWLGSIEAVDRPFQGYWEVRGWVKRAVVRTMSRIDTPADGTRAGRELVLAGIAYAGNRGIRRVEVSLDGGRTWRDARLETELSPFTWRRWALRVRPPRGRRLDVTVRATDGTGAVQTGAVTPPEYSGSTGYDEVIVES